jgi:hypothetical protein
MIFCDGFSNGSDSLKIPCNVRWKPEKAMQGKGPDIYSIVEIAAGIKFSEYLKSGMEESSHKYNRSIFSNGTSAS